ncbi:UDP-N-acetylmuramate--L-alanine ligase [Candidatus Peregrinibacteria bacterium]|nr:UDP-N-acetylmuramate--L-alanine ligase [Candidatus Peregrinibacteria bacterium]
MRIFCSGIGGIGLSAYAALQRENGHTVSGSDRSLSAVTDALSSMGISVTDNQDGSAVPADCDLLVYSEAIPPDAPERVRATESGIPQMNYFQALGELSRGMQVIAVCGTHGKSSTTAMAALALIDAGLDPTVVVGTRVPQLGGNNWRKGSGDLFVLEACEYRGSFLHLDPSIIVVTTVDWDHVDAYPTQESYREAFTKFFARLPRDGVVITHMQDDNCSSLIQKAKNRKPLSGVVDADTFAAPTLSIPGAHMRENAKLVVALARHLGIGEDAARHSLQSFAGTWRRMEMKGDTKSGVTVVDDYAHHPKEIMATVSAMREKFPSRRLVCCFQPHMHDRTIALYGDFTKAFEGCDAVFITDVYEARRETGGAKADVVKLAKDIGATYTGTLMNTEATLHSDVLKSGDVLLVMGAGDITELASRMSSAS